MIKRRANPPNITINGGIGLCLILSLTASDCKNSGKIIPLKTTNTQKVVEKAPFKINVIPSICASEELKELIIKIKRTKAQELKNYYPLLLIIYFLLYLLKLNE